MLAFSSCTVYEEMYNAAPQAEGDEFAAGAMPEFFYSGENTMTKYHGTGLPFLFALTGGVSALFVGLALKPEFREGNRALVLVYLFSLLAFLAASAGLQLARRHHYRHVTLRFVQAVVPQVVEAEQEGRMLKYSLHFPVVVDGQVFEGRTEKIFNDDISDDLSYRDYVGTAQNAGYDPERRCWVII